jgi:hypothetical protein
MPRRWNAVALLISLSLASACGSSTLDDTPVTSVEVQNNLVPATSVTVYAESSGGSLPMLGTVAASRTQKVSANLTGRYRFVAATAVDPTVRTYSQHVEIDDGGRYRWDVRNNVLTRIGD